jgi:quinol monooxygenase YgiN
MSVVVMTMNVSGLTHKEFRSILDEMGVEARPEPGIYQHISHPTETGFRIIEIWESQEGFEEFAERRLQPAVTRLGIQRETTIRGLSITGWIFAPPCIALLEHRLCSQVSTVQTMTTEKSKELKEEQIQRLDDWTEGSSANCVVTGNDISQMSISV